MARKDPEWIGKNDDEAIPPRVKLRILIRQDKKCAHCGFPISEIRKPAFDHIVALVNGGAHAEHNLQVLHVSPCHAEKTKKDVAEKSTIFRKIKKSLGLTGPRKKIQSRGFQKSEPQRSASRPIERMTTKPAGCDPCSYPACGCAYSENDPRRADAMSDDIHDAMLEMGEQADPVREALRRMLAEFGDEHYHTCPADNRSGPCDCFAGHLIAESMRRLKAET